MKIDEFLSKTMVRIRSALFGKDTRPKVPRKKIELSLKKLDGQLNKQFYILDQLINRQKLSSASNEMAIRIHQDASEFIDLKLIKINQIRLRNLTTPMLEPNDFSVWTTYRARYLTEQIYYFLTTVQEEF